MLTKIFFVLLFNIEGQKRKNDHSLLKYYQKKEGFDLERLETDFNDGECLEYGFFNEPALTITNYGKCMDSLSSKVIEKITSPGYKTPSNFLKVIFAKINFYYIHFSQYYGKGIDEIFF